MILKGLETSISYSLFTYLMACLSDCRQVVVLCTYLHHHDHECTSMSSIYWWQFGIKPLPQHDCKETRHSTSVSFKKVPKNQVSLFFETFLIGEKSNKNTFFKRIMKSKLWPIYGSNWHISSIEPLVYLKILYALGMIKALKWWNFELDSFFLS